MKRIVFLVIVVWCWMGSAWGQVPSIGSISKENVTCKGFDNGKIFGTITPGLTTPPYVAYLFDNNNLGDYTIAYAIASVRTENYNFIFDDVNSLPPGSYRVRVAEEGSTSLSPQSGLQTIEEPDVFEITIGPNVITDACGLASIFIRVEGGVVSGTTPYRMTITNSDDITREDISYTGNFTFPDLPSGTYIIEGYDANGCGPVTATVPITTSPVVTADKTIHFDVICKETPTGRFTINGTSGSLVNSYFEFLIYNDKEEKWDLEYFGLNSYEYKNKIAGVYLVKISDGDCESTPIEVTILEPDVKLTLNEIYHFDPLCHGNLTGESTIEALGGWNDSYTYRWIDSKDDPLSGTYLSTDKKEATNLPAGSYTAFVEDDKGCEISIPIVITQPEAPLVVSATPTKLTCDETMTNPDGKITVNATGGTKPYIYKIDGPSLPPGYTKESQPTNSESHPFENLPAGTYTITVTDANGCGDDTEEEVKAAKPIIATITPASSYEAACADEEVTFSVTALSAETGVNRNLEYNFNKTGWKDTGALPFEIGSVANTGNYDIDIEIRYKQEPYKSTCPVFTAEHSITIPEALKFTAASTPVDCYGKSTGTIVIKVTGGSGSYIPVITPTAGTVKPDVTEGIYTLFVVEGLKAGEYTISVTDSKSCTGTPSVVGGNKITVEEPDELKITNTEPIKATCFDIADGTITLNVEGGTGEYTYTLNGSSAIPDDGTVSQPVFLVYGRRSGRTYSIEVQDENGCKATTSGTVGLPENIRVQSISNDPNPITCHTDAGNVKIIVNINSYDTDPGLEGLEGYIRKKGELAWLQGVFKTSPDLIEFSGLGEEGETTTYEIWLKYAKDKSGYGTTRCHRSNTHEHTVTIPAPIKFTAAVVKEISCNGGDDGKISVTITKDGYTGAGAKYMYGINSGTVWQETGATWQDSNVFDNLEHGDHVFNVKVVISGSDVCFAVQPQTVSLANPVKLSLFVTGKDNILCPMEGNIGKITVSASGGKPGYTYSLYNAAGPGYESSLLTEKETPPPGSGIFEGLAPGTYTVKVMDDTGVCHDTIVRTITKPEMIDFSVTTSTPTLACDDAGATIRINLSSPTYEANKYVYRLKDRNNWKVFRNTAEDTIKVVGGGTYTIEMAYANKTDCDVHVEQDITIGVQSDVGIKIAGIKNACPSGQTASITVSGNTALPSGATYVLWRLKANFSLTSPEVELNNLQNYDQIRTSFSAPVAANTFANLTAGIYMVIATVDNCFWKSNLYDITGPDELGVNYALTEVFPACPNNESGDGEMRVVAEGGTEPYTFTLYYRNTLNNYAPIPGHPSNNDGIFKNLPVKSGGIWDDIYYIGISDANGCSMSPHQPVPKSDPFPQSPPLELELDPAHVLCEGGTGSATVTVTGGRKEFDYEWFQSNTGEAASWSSFVPTPGITENIVLGLGLGFYKVEVTDGCSDTQTSNIIEIEDRSLKIVDSSSEDGITCDGKPAGTITVDVTGGTPNSSGAKYSYIIKKDGVSFVPDVNDIDISYDPVTEIETYTISGLNNGVYTIEATDGKCSPNPSVTETIVNPAPLTVTVTGKGAMCHNDENDGSITVTVNGGTPKYYMTILDDNKQVVIAKTEISSGEELSFPISMNEIAVGTTKRFTVEIEDKYCSVTKTVDLRRPAELVVTLIVEKYICPSEGPSGKAKISEHRSGGTGNLKDYEIYKDDILIYDHADNSWVYDQFEAGTYYFNVKDQNGCPATTNKITVHYTSLDFDDYLVIGVTCPEDKTGSIEILNPTGGISDSKYEYHVFKKGETEPDRISHTETITDLGRGDYYILMKLDPSEACSTDDLRIPIEPTEYITIGANIQVDEEYIEVFAACESDSGKPTVEFMVAWNNGLGNLVVMLECDGKIYYPQQYGSSDGKWKYRAELEKSGEASIIVYDGSDCPLIIPVFVPESLSFSWKPTDDNCEDISSIELTIEGGELPYNVKFNTDPWVETEENSFTISNVIAGIEYNVEVIDAKCPNSISEKIELPKPISLSAVTSDIREASCSGNEDGYIRLSSAEPYIYTWMDVAQNFNPEKLKKGVYTVTISYQDGSCPIEKEFTVEAANNIEVKIIGNDSDDKKAYFCPDDQIYFLGEVFASGRDQAMYETSAEWALPDGARESWEDGIPLNLLAAQGPVTLTATINVPGGTCIDSDEITVVLNPAPIFSLMDTLIYIPKGIVDYQLEVDASGFTEYEWTASASNIPSLPTWPEQSSPSPVILSSPDEIYKLTLTLSNGECTAKQDFYVDYALDLFIPNFFTPNGREPNNTWKFRELPKWTTIFDIDVVVFTRNGAQVYSAKGYNNESVVWDGRRNGENVPIGTYYYVVTLVPKSTSRVTPPRPIRGAVTIMR